MAGVCISEGVKFKCKNPIQFKAALWKCVGEFRLTPLPKKSSKSNQVNSIYTAQNHKFPSKSLGVPPPLK